MKANKEYLLGIDTGGSKTHALIADLSGNVLGFGEAGCGNYEIIGLEGFKKAIQEAAKRAIRAAGIQKEDVHSMGFGLCGYDWPSEKPLMVQGIESLGIAAPYQFVNDVIIGLVAGSSAGWGVAVDAGSGNNVRGRDESGKMGKITGNGMMSGEFGGAGEMLWLAAVNVIYAWSQRGPKTKLSRLFMDYAEVSSESELVEKMVLMQARFSPSLAESIIKLAYEGDKVARNIVDFSASELGKNTNAVIHQLNLQDSDFDVVLIGSVFKAGEIYLTPFTETVLDFAPGVNFIHLEVPPVVGAVLLAAETAKIDPGTIRETLIASTQEMLSNR
jgi:N-acetylglucosamine kinase-like BadF-type ATPase